MKLFASATAALAVAALSATAGAHSLLTDPVPLTNDDDAKSGPCGCYFGAPETPGEDATPSACPASFSTTDFAPGATITVKWIETVNHNGAFRIAYAPIPVDQVTKADLEAGILYEQPDTNPTSGAMLEATVTLPDTPCPDCTLQLRQFMETTYYYSCASISIGGGSGTTGGSTTGGSTTGGGGAGGDATGGATTGAGNGATGAGAGDSAGAGLAPGPGPDEEGGCSVAPGTTGRGAPIMHLAIGALLAAGLTHRLRRRASRPAA